MKLALDVEIGPRLGTGPRYESYKFTMTSCIVGLRTGFSLFCSSKYLFFFLSLHNFSSNISPYPRFDKVGGGGGGVYTGLHLSARQTSYLVYRFTVTSYCIKS